MIERIGTTERLSKIVKHNGIIYLSGQLCDDPAKGITEQTTTMLAKVDDLLEQANSDKHHILSAILYIKTMKDFAEMNAIWNNWLPEGYAPARACVEANMSSEELLIEVSIVAAEKT